jgi:hypothetical protein
MVAALRQGTDEWLHISSVAHDLKQPPWLSIRFDRVAEGRPTDLIDACPSWERDFWVLSV